MTKVLDILLPVIGCSLLLALTIVMVCRKLHREYPFFFVYVVFSLVSPGFFLLAASNHETYSYAYWLSAGFSAIFVLFALNEAFYDVFYRFHFFWWFRLIFPSVVVVLCLFAVKRGLIHPVSHRLLLSVIFSVNGTLSLIQAGVFLIFLLLALRLHVRWLRYPFDIALGFAVAGAGDWILYVLLCQPAQGSIVRYVPPATYICATLIWLWSFSRKRVFGPEMKRDTVSRRSAPQTRVRHRNWKLFNYSRFMPR